MNTASDDSTRDGLDLPVLGDDRVDAIESSLFAAIGRERTTRRKRRTRLWVVSAAAAVVVVVAAAIAPTVTSLVSGAGSSDAGSAVGSAPASPNGEVAPGTGLRSTGGSATDANSGAADSAVGAADSAAIAPGAATGTREVITTASATVVVDDVAAAARQVANTAVAHDGYVESMSVGSSGQPMPVDPDTGIVKEMYPAPDGAWVTIRVPSGQLDEVVKELSDLGEVTASSVNRQDVTEQTIDLRARVAAEQASVDRLTALLSQAQNVTDLVAIESALAERQANLESYQQQLEYLDGQVAMSSLTVTLVPKSEPVEADPAGFTDGLAAGWNGLVATLNGIVIAFGFLIPWIVVVGIAALIVWWIVRIVRRRPGRRPAAPNARADAAPESDTTSTVAPASTPDASSAPATPEPPQQS